ncbi:phospholipase A1-IIdelta [Arachis duranensis]|uniref:Phospholipase A1 n=1 Tax=Arachis duranensis TaxID=130453 RepID=A0A6P4CN01_ARADU|nr:phospholipase A1-IIdelta [Arachis duranensis]
MKGWLTIYTSEDPKSPFTKLSARTQVLTKVKALLKLYKDENPSVVLVGHSLGASLSIVSAFDLVENGITDVPVAAFVFGRLLGYEYTGVELEIDTRKSPNLKDSKNPSDWHNLQAMLHVVAGWNGKHGEFKLRVKRSLALVNKSCEFLKDEYRVPGLWWVEKNKGMVKRYDGEWVLDAPEAEDIPVPEDYD